MNQPSLAPTFDHGTALVRAFRLNQSVNLALLEHFQGRIWRRPLADHEAESRTIADLFIHLHNVQCTVLDRNDSEEPPKKLERAKTTKAQVRAGLKRTEKALVRLLEAVTFSGRGRLPKERPDIVASVGRLIAHDAHHRGQSLLACRTPRRTDSARADRADVELESTRAGAPRQARAAFVGR